jgi:hypothetical protein
MTPFAPLTSSADPGRTIPDSSEERSWQISAALETLDREEQRLGRLGFELPLARCREQRRFWEFVRAIHTLDEPQAPPARRGAW